MRKGIRAEYRLHFRDARGALTRVEIIVAEDDDVALQRAEIRHHPFSVDVLREGRRIGTIPPRG